MWLFFLNYFSSLPLLLLLLPYSFQVLSQQVPFLSSLKLNDNKHFTLKQVLHHGGISNSTKNLFRKLEIKQNQNSVFEGFSYTGSGPSGDYVVNCLEETRASEFGTNNVDVNRKKIPIPNQKDVASILNLAKMSYNAYLGLSKQHEWIDLGDLDYEKFPLGWEEAGLRGYIFSDTDNSTVIIAFKGTSVKYVYDDGETAPNDKYNDNLMFSCCCAQIDVTWRGICDCKEGNRKCNDRCVREKTKESDSYFKTSLKIYDQVKKDYPNSTIWLTGHSLGGSIASLVALTHDLPAIVFQSPGEMLYAERIGLDTKNSSASKIYHFGHSADPISTGDCVGLSTCYAFGFALETKCHIGKSCMYDTISLGWKSDIRHHGLSFFIEKVIKEWSKITEGEKEIADCEIKKGCKDCGHWEFV